MLQSKVHLPFEHYSVPGKVFLLGEYAVLAGLPALVATVEPRFQMRVKQGAIGNSEKNEFHPDSPLGKLLSWAKNHGLPELYFQFEDPLQGRGGLGASTAQFAVAYLAYAQRMESLKRDWKSVRELYRDLMGTQDNSLSIPPSGADLVAQWQGGTVIFDPTENYCRDVAPLLEGHRFLIFSATSQAGRKVPTHEHLAQLKAKGFPESHEECLSELKKVLQQAVQSIQNQDFKLLGQSFHEYANILHQAGLETQATYEDRSHLSQLPGVLGVKGMGALQSDGILILMDQENESRDDYRQTVIHTAQRRGLKLLNDGLTYPMGVACHPLS